MRRLNFSFMDLAISSHFSYSDKKLDPNDSELFAQILDVFFQKVFYPPLTMGDLNDTRSIPILNQHNQEIGQIHPTNVFSANDRYRLNLRTDICRTFGISEDDYEPRYCRIAESNLKTWLEDQLNVDLRATRLDLYQF